MNGSFLFKDGLQRVSGYLIQGDTVVRCRLNCPTGNVSGMICFYEDGTDERCEVPQNGKEAIWDQRMKRIIGAVVIGKDEILLQTDDKAYEKAEYMIQRERKKTESADRACIRKPEAKRNQERGDRTKQERQEEQKELYTQRRWPPPPCMPSARYKNGCWEEEKESL